MEAYRTAKTGSREQTRKAMERFHRAFRMIGHGPFFDDAEFRPEMFHLLEREIEHLMLRPPHREPEPKKPPRTAEEGATARRHLRLKESPARSLRPGSSHISITSQPVLRRCSFKIFSTVTKSSSLRG